MRILDPRIAADRKKQLLQWIIHEFIRTSKPVGSAAIADAGLFKLSPASIRNILKDLETEGYLYQPHTSAGRVPTDKGYRQYVEYLTKMQRLAAQEKARIEEEYRRRAGEMDELLIQTSRMLSTLSNSVGFVLSPKIEDQPLKRLEILRIGPKRLLAVLITDAGLVRHCGIEVQTDPDPAKLAHINQFLNERLVGHSVLEVQKHLGPGIAAAARDFQEMQDLTRDLLVSICEAVGPESLYFQGASNIVNAGDFDDMESLRSLLRVVEDKQRFAEALQAQLEEEMKDAPDDSKALIRVRIGEENPLPELRGLSLVSTAYKVQGRVVGLLGVLGPKRMEYSRMMGLVDYMSEIVSRSLEEFADEKEGTNGDE